MHLSQTVVCGVSSTSASVLSRIPQGSALAPLLFLLYINGVTEMVTKECSLSLYTDDNLLFFEITGRTNYATVQDNIDLVHALFNECFMEFNTFKMLISQSHVGCNMQGMSVTSQSVAIWPPR